MSKRKKKLLIHIFDLFFILIYKIIRTFLISKLKTIFQEIKITQI